MDDKGVERLGAALKRAGIAGRDSSPHVGLDGGQLSQEGGQVGSHRIGDLACSYPLEQRGVALHRPIDSANEP